MAIPIVNTPLPHFQQLIPLRLLGSNLAVSGKPLWLVAFKIYSIQWISKICFVTGKTQASLCWKTWKDRSQSTPVSLTLLCQLQAATLLLNLSAVRFQSLCPWSQWWMWQWGHAFLWSISHSDHLVKCQWSRDTFFTVFMAVGSKLHASHKAVLSGGCWWLYWRKYLAYWFLNSFILSLKMT